MVQEAALLLSSEELQGRLVFSCTVCSILLHTHVDLHAAPSKLYLAVSGYLDFCTHSQFQCGDRQAQLLDAVAVLAEADIAAEMKKKMRGARHLATAELDSDTYSPVGEYRAETSASTQLLTQLPFYCRHRFNVAECVSSWSSSSVKLRM
jgi:hypothetical protein